MSRQTTNYGYNISEGSDIVNPLVDIFPNWEAIDSDLKGVSNDAVGGATELTTGTVHALTRSDTDRNVFVFTATSNFTAGDTFTLDGDQVSALTPAGEQLATGCYIIGSNILVAVHGTLMTMYVSPTKVDDSDKLDGHDSTYFATASSVSELEDDFGELSAKVGIGILTTDAQSCVGGINELNGKLDGVGQYYSNSNAGVTVTSNDGLTNIAQVTLPKGMYVVTGTVRSNNANEMTYFLATSSTSASIGETGAVTRSRASAGGGPCITHIYGLTEQKTIYLVTQNFEANSHVYYGQLQAIRIK